MTAIILLSFLAYLLAIFVISWRSGGSSSSNEAFYLANRSTPWWVVAIGMVGDSISGVTFVSVPGMVGSLGMSYIQLCIGFFLGYIAVAYILLPLYYRLQVVSIYEYLGRRYGPTTYKTGALFFVISKLFGAAAKLYLISLILQSLAFEALGVPYPLTVLGLVLLIWLYTRRGGMGTIIWTDVLQTLSLVVALALIIYELSAQLGLDLAGVVELVRTSPHHRIFYFEDWMSPQHFVKQVLSGAFIVIVMTGLDQNMMQKNLSCRTLSEARKNMLTYGFSFIPLNYLFLVLGILLLYYAESKGITLPDKGDEILPYLASNYLGKSVLVLFTLGITAASFSNADSALTSLTTSVCVDLIKMPEAPRAAERRRSWVHLAMCSLFALLVLFIGGMQQSSVLNTIFVAVSYTYGPLLGLYAYGLMCRREVRDGYTPLVCLLAPILSHLCSLLLSSLGYTTGYELLLLNGLITMLGLWLIRK
ncbi:MAG: sodium:solute symporter [Porphyromonas sp.]|nr:sodium:solute symporter [Porphyromonas sp.]